MMTVTAFIFLLSCFFFNDTATTEIYTLSLHDALPIFHHLGRIQRYRRRSQRLGRTRQSRRRDRKSTRLNSSHMSISYAVFCLKKKRGVPDAEGHRRGKSPKPHPGNAVRTAHILHWHRG